MRLFPELGSALVVAVIIGVVLMVVLRRRAPAGGVLALLTVLFLATWAGGAWVTPMGPPLWGVHLLSFGLVGLVVALLLVVFASRRPPRRRGEALRQVDARRETVQTLDAFFWVLVALLVLAIAVRYL